MGCAKNVRFTPKACFVPTADIRDNRPNKPIASSIRFAGWRSLQGGSVRWSGIDQPSIQIGHKHLGVGDGIGIDCEDVAVNHDQIGALADFETAGGRVLLQGEGGINGIGVDRRPERNSGSCSCPFPPRRVTAV